MSADALLASELRYDEHDAEYSKLVLKMKCVLYYCVYELRYDEYDAKYSKPALKHEVSIILMCIWHVCSMHTNVPAIKREMVSPSVVDTE